MQLINKLIHVIEHTFDMINERFNNLIIIYIQS